MSSEIPLALGFSRRIRATDSRRYVTDWPLLRRRTQIFYLRCRVGLVFGLGAFQ